MADLPLKHKANKESTEKESVPGNKVEVTHENADILTVHFLSQIYGRLGYIVKLLEEKK